ncbi:MAG: DUF4097 family beta strand repeat protein [Planctomycetales bacterium]|nr:DUF4097 family beta strand repeat protein [Planctomycetales bacterium]
MVNEAQRTAGGLPRSNWTVGLMGTLALVAAAGCGVRLVVGGFSFDFQGATAERSDAGDIHPAVRDIDVDYQFGDVVIRPTDGPARWSWSVKCWADDPDVAQRFADQTKLETTAGDGSQSWKLVMPEDAKELRGIQSRLELLLPEDCAARVANRHGGCEIEGIGGDVVVESRHGDVALSRLAGKVESRNAHGATRATDLGEAVLQNEHGELTLEDAGSARIEGAHGRTTVVRVAGPLHIESRHGDIDVREIDGRTELRNAHAAIRTEQIRDDLVIANEFGEVRVTEASGAVRVENRHGATTIDSRGDRIECRSEHGGVKVVSLAPDLKELRVVNRHGSIDATLPETLQAQFRLSARHGEVDNAFNEGVEGQAAVVSLDAEFGAVRVHKAPAAEVASEQFSDGL